jgi:hypothetical protein
MRAIALTALALPLVLAACATTPLGKCQAPYRSQLRNVQQDARETQRRLARGYRLVPARTTFGLHYCMDAFGNARICRAEEGEPLYDKRPINRAAEQAKLDALAQEEKRLNAALAECAARYPE